MGNTLLSQIKIHEKYGGVFPMMAKREHSKTLTPLLQKVLNEAKELGANARKTIEEKFSLNKFVENWNNVFYNTLEKI